LSALAFAELRYFETLIFAIFLASLSAHVLIQGAAHYFRFTSKSG
jgi:hypothetical protein